jgi:putative tryptophan/tyrosine transport system substrate-binding protein
MLFGAWRVSRRLGRLLPLAGLLLAGLASAADQPYRIELLLSQGNGPYQALAQALDDELAALGREDLRLRQSLVEAHDPDAIASADLVVTVGSRASRILHPLPARGQVLHVLIPSTAHPFPPPQGGNGVRHSAIYIDQPWSRQLNLIRLTLPGVERVGILLGSTSRELRKELEQAITARHWQAQFGLVPDDGNYLGPLRRLLEQSEVLLAVPDQQVFNRQNLQGILLSSYRREVPMIGFSPGYVRAGALAAVYSTPEQIATQAVRWIAPLLADPDHLLPPPRHPDYYSVAVNHQVARSLGLRIPGEEDLLQGLQALEGQP